MALMQKVESELLFLKGYSVQLNDACSDYFTFEMLFHCSDTWLRVQCPNLPLQVESWQAYRELAIEILDPVVRQYGQPRLTYGFCGTELRMHIPVENEHPFRFKMNADSGLRVHRFRTPQCTYSDVR